MYTSEYLAIIIQLYKKRYGDINVHASVSTYFVFLLVYGVCVFVCVFCCCFPYRNIHIYQYGDT